MSLGFYFPMTAGRRSLSAVPSSTQRRVSSKRSMQRLTEDELLELYKMSYGGGRKSSKAAQEEEEVRKKMMRKPSRKISRLMNIVQL